jgi:hypothetical protein
VNGAAGGAHVAGQVIAAGTFCSTAWPHSAQYFIEFTW